jgi:hypothetical protein
MPALTPRRSERWEKIMRSSYSGGGVIQEINRTRHQVRESKRRLKKNIAQQLNTTETPGFSF